MGKIPENLRQTIATNIRACRMNKFPGRGGGKQCAKAFGVSPQQWSSWARGMRTPDELRLAQLADFFGVTVEYLRRDNSTPDTPSGSNSAGARFGVSSNEEEPGDGANRRNDGEAQSSVSSFPCCPFYRPPKPDQPLSDNVHSLCWLAERFFGDVRNFGITFRLHPNDIASIIECLTAHKAVLG